MTTFKYKRRKTQLTFNGKTYEVLKYIGRGGSCIYDHLAKGFKAEIELLEKLSEVDRMAKLLDAEINDILMELGEADFHMILNRRLNDVDSKFDISFTQFYWKEMLEWVAAFHRYDIFFGIANAIPDDTVNIQRGSMVGTPNFVSPEALLFTQSEDDQEGIDVYTSGA
ncbi:hypothetical protein B7494_g7669 [Chlorociboria aeruginascens]|nr:hypothetical protein B7494_g7669 [Chlorociboria aeruginascens]